MTAMLAPCHLCSRARPPRAVSILASAFALAALIGCGGGSTPAPEDSACGVAPASRAPVRSCSTIARCDAGCTEQSECAQGCTSVATCGAGASNQRKPLNCEHCFAGYDSHVCEAGACRAVDTTPGPIRVLMGLSGLGSGAQSVMLAALHPTAADGTRLTCAKLLSTCAWRDNPAINANVITQAIAQTGDTLQSSISVEPGAGRLVFVGLTSEPQGRGALLAKGCVEDVDVVHAMATTVAIELVAP
jgi:hypothetical protein